MSAPRGGATIRDVAREAGVSVGTVSKVMNQTGTIAPDTRKRVLDVANRLQFRPNTLARSLQSGLSGSIGLISNDAFGRFTMPILEGLDTVLAPQGIGVFMCNATDDPAREAAHVAQLMAKQVDGIIVTARRSDRRPASSLAGLGIPVIHVFATGEGDGLTLLPDDRGGAALAVDHLMSLGHRSIAHVTGPAHFEAVRLRQRGIAEAMTAAGLTPGPVLHGAWSEAWGRAALVQLFGRGGARPRAIFCGNDLIARGVADAARDMGLDVPRDVALAGFDNWTLIAEATRPPLTSVDMNLMALGQEAGRAMQAMIRGEALTGQRLLPCTLVPRASTLG